MKHSANEVLDGETAILTLADEPLLDELGRLREAPTDALEDVVLAQQKARDKARRAAGKAVSLLRPMLLAP